MTKRDLPSLPATLIITLLLSALPPLLAALSWMIWPLKLAK